MNILRCRKSWISIISILLILFFYINEFGIKLDVDVVKSIPMMNFDVNVETSNMNLDADVVKSPPKYQACIHPRLDPGPNAFPYKKLSPIRCSGEKDWVYTGDGKFYISSEAVAKHGEITCDTVAIDKSIKDGMQRGFQVKNQLNNTELHSDHFEVKCRAADGNLYENVHTGIKVDRDKKVGDGNGKGVGDGTMGVNVLMVAFDSLSRPSLQIQMPRTHDLFVNKLGGQLLEGYNIIGDGTTFALIPMLTGSEQQLLPETRCHFPNAQSVDCYPFIWKEFENKGYVTHFFEDRPKMSVFTEGLLGFRDQPVHHYMRPFHLAAENRIRRHCLGSIPIQELHYNSLKQSFQIHANTGKPIFAFTFAKAGHDDNNLIQPWDNSTADFLQHLDSHGYLNNTIVMLFGDHGSRYRKLRITERGKLEERMPYVGFLFPKWFDKKFPLEMGNFKVNTKRLSVPFDIHATLKHILFSRKPKTAHVIDNEISLFDEIPPERTCAHAHIQPHWCACFNWQNVPTNDSGVFRAANTIVEYINRMLDDFSDQCARLQLASVQSAKTYSIQDSLLRFDKSLDRDRFIPSFFKSELKSNILIYQITIVTKPGKGVFEATIEKNIQSDTFKPNEKDISRLNKYGNAAKCIVSRAPHFGEYCYCK